jgi:hypothetical protein
MATYNTKAGTTYDDRKGSAIGQKGSAFKKKVLDNLDSSYANMYIPATDMNSLGAKEVAELLKRTKEKGSLLTKQEVLDITGSYFNPDNKFAYYEYLIDQNANTYGFDSRGENSKQYYIKNEEGTYIESPTSIIDESSDTSGIEEYRQLIQELLPKDSQSSYMQQYQNDMYNAINQYEQSTMATLAGSEMEAYRAIGQQQLQLENQIAEQRMRAIKSGVTSAQLASQELAGIFAAQSGASQIASQVMQNKVDAANTFAQQRAAVPGDMYSMLNTNQQTATNAYAQLAAAQASYNSYIQQPYRNFDASAKTLGLYGEDYYNTLMGFQKTTK